MIPMIGFGIIFHDLFPNLGFALDFKITLVCGVLVTGDKISSVVIELEREAGPVLI